MTAAGFFFFFNNKCIVELYLLFLFGWLVLKRRLTGCLHLNMLKRHHQSFTEFSFILLISFSCVLFFLAVTFNSRAVCPSASWHLSRVTYNFCCKSFLLRRGENFIGATILTTGDFMETYSAPHLWWWLNRGWKPNFSLPFGLPFLGLKTKTRFWLQWMVPQAVFPFSETTGYKTFPPSSTISFNLK